MHVTRKYSLNSEKPLKSRFKKTLLYQKTLFDIKSRGKMTVEYLLCFLKSVHLGIGYIKNKLPNKQINKQTIHIRCINKY